MTLACSLLSLLMLGAAGAMIDSHRRDWRNALSRRDLADGDTATWRFTLWRHRRRMTASVFLAIAGVLIALWPATPRTPRWAMAHAGALAIVAIGLLGCGLADAIASGRHYRRLSRELVERQRRELAEELASRGRAAATESHAEPSD